MGKNQGPPLFDSVGILGKDRTRARLLKTIEFLGGISNKKMEKLHQDWHQRNCKALVAPEEVTINR
jgi:glutamyl-tRNA synthetase